MSLEFTDYARFYAASGMNEAEQRGDFEVYACFMESLVRHFWRQEPLPNSLGINVDNDALALMGTVDSALSLQSKFNNAGSMAGKADK